LARSTRASASVALFWIQDPSQGAAHQDGQPAEATAAWQTVHRQSGRVSWPRARPRRCCRSRAARRRRRGWRERGRRRCAAGRWELGVVGVGRKDHRCAW